MKYYRLLFIQAATLCLFIASAAAQPHEFTPQQCARCHLSAPDGGVQIFTAEIDTLCKGCHTLADVNGHPTPVKPSMSISPELWLDAQGRVNCATCHDPHPDTGDAPPYLLRGGVTGTSFCALCHEADVPHRGAIFLAHSKAYTPPQGGAGLDPVSRDCLDCHDPDAPHASVCIIGRPGQCAGHVVGFDYDAAARRNVDLNPRSSIPPLVSLYEGKVGCASCHSIYSREPAMLVFSNEGSALCLACHGK